MGLHVSDSGYRVLVDGYNVINRSRAWADRPLELARHALMEWLSQTKWPVPVRHVEAVFDASQHLPRASNRMGCVEARFAVPSADAYIQHAIQASARPNRLMVISDDRAILHTAARYGTLRFSTSWLLRRRPLPSMRMGPANEERQPLTTAERHRITEELAKRWGVQ